MNTLLLEDDVFNHILAQVASTGLSPSAYLRPKLNLSSPTEKPLHINDHPITGVKQMVASLKFRSATKAVDRFLLILSALHREKPKDFEDVATLVEGRSRKYFAGTKQELESSGRSVNPKKIPDCPFWVITNNDTRKKKRILEDVMQGMNYTDYSIQGVIDAL